MKELQGRAEASAVRILDQKMSENVRFCRIREKYFGATGGPKDKMIGVSRFNWVNHRLALSRRPAFQYSDCCPGL